MAIDFLTKQRHPMDKKTRLMITGGKSMIGRAIQRQLNWINFSVDLCPHDEVDFQFEDEVRERIRNFEPDYLIALAGYNGGIKFNAEQPADIYAINSRIAINTLHSAWELGVKKVVYVMPSCSYPSMDFMSEKDYWNGPCHESVECHGLARSHFLEYSRQLYKQYGFKSVGICCNTVYGNFDHFDENAKVMGSMIRKFVEAKEQNLPNVTLWGTGKPKRGFIHCEDVARGILNVLESYDDPMELINLPCEEISMKDLAHLIAYKTDYKGDIIWDTSKTDGQMRKMLDSTKYTNKYKTVLLPLEVGVGETVKWYEENK